MSREILEKIIGRAAMDSQFRRRMIEDPETTLKEYDLTEEQLSAIKAIPTNALEKFAHQLMESFGKDLPESVSEKVEFSSLNEEKE